MAPARFAVQKCAREKRIALTGSRRMICPALANQMMFPHLE